MSRDPLYLSGVWDFDGWGGYHSEIKESKDLADRLKSGVNCVNLTNFAPLDMIKKPTSLTKNSCNRCPEAVEGSVENWEPHWWHQQLKKNPFYLQKLCSDWKKLLRFKFTEAGIQLIHAFVRVKGQWKKRFTCHSSIPEETHHSVITGICFFLQNKGPNFGFYPVSVNHHHSRLLKKISSSFDMKKIKNSMERCFNIWKNI